MRLLIDYRAALRERSGVGEYTHELARALLTRGASAQPPDTPIGVTLFSSSWKDRLLTPPDLAGASVVDRRVPVAVLNFAWHRLEWPSAETIAGGSFDVVHSMHPLLMPARRAAQVVTIHDLNFLAHPDRTRAEIRRDYPSLARQHAQRADRVVVVSQYTAREVQRRLDVPADRISVCSPGAPPWPARIGPAARDAYVLFFGTLEPRKNVGVLLDAYERLAARRDSLPDLVLAGRATPDSTPWLDRIGRAPLNRYVRHVGYVAPEDRRALYQGASLLVQPSFDEGFGLPVLEAMTSGIPVIAANRGALPEVAGGAATLFDPDDADELGAAIEQATEDTAFAAAMAARGVGRARLYTWERTAKSALEAYQAALDHRRARRGSA